MSTTHTRTLPSEDRSRRQQPAPTRSAGMSSISEACRVETDIASRMPMTIHPVGSGKGECVARQSGCRLDFIVGRRENRTSAYFRRQTQTRFEADMALRADLLPALAAFESAARHQNFAHAAE